MSGCNLVHKQPGETFHGWWVEACCPDCGAPLVHVADGRPDPTRSRAVARCAGVCGRTWVVQVTIADASRELGRRPRPHATDCGCAGCTNRLRGRTHGTESTYTNGCRCDDCRQAGTEANRRRRAARRRAA